MSEHEIKSGDERDGAIASEPAADCGSTSLRVNRAELFKMLGYTPHEGQRKVHESRASRRILACGVRWGKTVCAAEEALAAALEPRERSMGWIVAPTYDLSERVFGQVVIAAASHLRHRIEVLKEHEHRLVIRNLGGGLSEIRGKSADNPVSLLGEGLDYVIVDEAARLKPTIWENYLTQRLLDRRGWALLISTPRGKGWFYELWRRGKSGQDPSFESWNQPSSLNPLLDKELIEAERERLPERAFRQEYLAEFLEGSGAVFRNVREIAVLPFSPPREGKRYYAGLDLAKVSDWTVLTILDEERNVVFMDRFQRLDWGLQVARIKGALDRYNKALVCVDSTGAGDPIYEALLREGCRAEGYAFTAQSKRALIDNLALSIEQKRVHLPLPQVFPECVEELEGFEYTVSDSGAVRTGAPYGMHDDIVISLGLALWAWRVRPRGVMIGVLSADMKRVIPLYQR